MKLWKTKEKEEILKADRVKVPLKKKWVNNFLLPTMEVSRQLHGSLNVLKENNYQPRILYPTKISFKNKSKIRQRKTNTA